MYELQLVRKKVFWYLRLVSPGNGQTLLTSETYYTKSNAQRAALKLVNNLNAIRGIKNVEYREL